MVPTPFRIMELFIARGNSRRVEALRVWGGSFRFLQRVWTIAQEYMGAHKFLATPAMTKRSRNHASHHQTGERRPGKKHELQHGHRCDDGSSYTNGVGTITLLNQNVRLNSVAFAFAHFGAVRRKDHAWLRSVLTAR